MIVPVDEFHTGGYSQEAIEKNWQERTASLLQYDGRALIVAFTGSGISQASGIPTFRDRAEGLWEQHNPEDIASIWALQDNPEKVFYFFNLFRTACQDKEPNIAHKSLVELESKYRVAVITQNVDGLHEQAGSSFVLPIHGQLNQVRGGEEPYYHYYVREHELKLGDTCQIGSQLRPAAVLFGDEVPLIRPAADLIKRADHIIVVGCGFQVAPANILLALKNKTAQVTVVDPEIAPEIQDITPLKWIPEKAEQGLPPLVADILL